MTREEVVALMRSSESADEWDANCDKVKVAFGNNYPDWWFSAVILSGVYAQTSGRWR